MSKTCYIDQLVTQWDWEALDAIREEEERTSRVIDSYRTEIEENLIPHQTEEAKKQLESELSYLDYVSEAKHKVAILVLNEM